MDQKKLVKVGKLIAETERAGQLLPDQVTRLMAALPTFNEPQIDELIMTLQGGITDAKDLEEACIRYEDVEIPKRMKALEERQQGLADQFIEESLATLKKEADHRMEQLSK